jgi:Gpi18-like mannosyltransferase
MNPPPSTADAVGASGLHGVSSAESSAQAARSWRSEPTTREILALAALIPLIGFLVIVSVDPFWERVHVFGDSPFYVRIAVAIRKWEFSDVSPWHFWGLPYVMAVVSLITSLSEWWSLVIVSLAAGVAATYLVKRLWGGWVAAYFLILSIEWQQRVLLGGAEPLFLLLLLASLLAVRRDRWPLAALFAALATVVRPLGIFLLIALGIVLLARKEYRKLIACTAIGLLVGIIYLVPFVYYFGDVLANFRFYQTNDWGSASPIGWPFVSIIQGAISFDLPWTARARSGFWILFYILAVTAMIRRPAFREYARRYPAEALFAGAYILFAFSYNSSVWAWVEFARYALPALPIALFALEAYLPHDRRLVWALAPVTGALSAMSAMNVRRILTIWRARFSG